MQAKGYQIIKGRGIAFIDDKKVKIKGSEVGYSLQKIESNIKTLNRLATDREFFKQVIQGKPAKSSAEVASSSLIKDENIFVTSQLKQDVSETIGALLKPEQMSEQVEPKLLVKKKKKKQRLRL